MIETYLRPAFQKMLIDPVVGDIAKLSWITPIVLTYIAGAVGVCSAVFLAFNYPYIACLMIVLSGYLDALDGSLARKKSMSSPKGAALDIVMDRMVEFAIMFGLFLVAPATRALPVIWMLGSSLICVTSFLVVGVFTENETEKSFHYSVGIMERAEAFAFYIVMILRPNWFFVMAWIYTCLVLLTAFIRILQFQTSAKV